MEGDIKTVPFLNILGFKLIKYCCVTIETEPVPGGVSDAVHPAAESTSSRAGRSRFSARIRAETDRTRSAR